MIDELRALAIFAKVVDEGSFRAAAEFLKLSPSVVSHHIAQLEGRLGVTLLYRSTRRLSLTHEGKALFSSAQAMILAAEQGLNHIAHQASEPSGKLNLAIPTLLTRSALVKDIAEFANEFYKVEFSLSFSDLQQDVIREGIDLAIRIGDLKDSALKSKKLFELKRKLVTAPSYLKNHKPPHRPQDLSEWDWIGLKMRPNTKRLISKVGQSFLIKFEPRIIADSIDAVSQLAINGLGLATPPAFLIENELRKGHLVEPLSAWHAESLPVYAIWPPNASKESLTFKLLTFLEKRKNLYF